MRKRPPGRLLGLLFIIIITWWFMQTMRLPATSSSLCSRLHFAAPCCHQTVVQAISCPVTPGVTAVLFSLLPHRTPKLNRRWMKTSAWIQAKTRFSPTNPGCRWLGRIQPISQLPSSCWPCNTYPKWHFGEAGRETLSYQTRKCQTCFVSSIKGLCFVGFFFHTTASCISMQTNWNSSREVGERPVKISFIFQTVFPGHLLGYVILFSLQLYSWKGK